MSAAPSDAPRDPDSSDTPPALAAAEEPTPAADEPERPDRPPAGPQWGTVAAVAAVSGAVAVGAVARPGWGPVVLAVLGVAVVVVGAAIGVVNVRRRR